MYIRIVNLKFASEIEADAMQAYAEHELINKLPGILSIEVVKVTNLHSVVINKFESQKHAEMSKDIIINKMKQNPNIKIEIFEVRDCLLKKNPNLNFRKYIYILKYLLLLYKNQYILLKNLIINS